MKKILIVTAIIVAILTGIIVIILAQHRCIQSHKEIKHREAWTQMVVTRKVIVPIFHPETDYEVDVCDRWEE